MAISYIQSAINSTTGASALATTWRNLTNTGNAVIVCIYMYTNGNTVTNVTDSRGNTYQLVLTGYINGDNLNMTMYYAGNIIGSAAASETVNVSFSGSTVAMVNIREYSGMPSTRNEAQDKATNVGVVTDTGTSTTPLSPTLLVRKNAGTLNNQQLLVSMASSTYQPQTWYVGNGFGNLDQVNNTSGGSFTVCDQIVNLTSSGQLFQANYSVGISAAWRAELNSFWDYQPGITPRTITAEPTTYWSY